MSHKWEQMKREAEEAALSCGHFALKELQLEVLRGLAHGQHVFGSLPTGYGKSACFWVPAKAWQWRVWVLCPLISLMEDQWLACEKLGIRSIALKTQQCDSLRRAQAKILERGDWSICFLSPERLREWARSGYLKKLRNIGLDPDLVVLDEMHCLEEWRSFRPSYGELFEHLKHWLIDGKLLLGLSASLSEKESHAWMEELCGHHVRVSGGLGRPNLRLRVIPLEQEEERWLLLLEKLKCVKTPGSALVYCETRRETDEVSRWLRSAGLEAVAYHAGLPREERVARSHGFRAGLLRIVCATSAFGMGIDYPKVDLVVHFSMPHDLESYWQEVGRAGRAGQEAEAVAFWRRSEISRVRRIGHDNHARERFVALWRAWISGRCRKQAVASRLGIENQECCGQCDRCENARGAGRALPWWLEREALADAWLEEKIKVMPGRDASTRLLVKENSP